MTDTRGTVEHTSEPVGVPRAELGFCTLGAVGLAVAAVASIFEHSADVDVPRGLYAILAAVGIIGINGWMIAWSSGRAERRAMATAQVELDELRKGQAEVSGALAELTSALNVLADQVAQQRVTYLPAAQQPRGHKYLSQAAVGAEHDTVPIGPARTGLDAETIAAARKVARQLLDGPTDPGLRAPKG